MVWGLKTLCTWPNAVASDNHGTTLLYTKSCDCWFSGKQPREELVSDAGLVTVQAERLRAWFVSNFRVSKFMRFLHFRTCHAMLSPQDGNIITSRFVWLGDSYEISRFLRLVRCSIFNFRPCWFNKTKSWFEDPKNIKKTHAGTHQQKKTRKPCHPRAFFGSMDSICLGPAQEVAGSELCLGA